MKLILLIVFGGYGLVCLAVYLLQSRLVYHPDNEDAGSPADIGLEFREVRFRTADGKELAGWMLPAPDAVFTVLYLHGNAGNRTHRVTSVQQLVAMGLSVFIFDYRGFGESSGRPSEQGTYADARAAWEHLVDVEKVPEDRILVLGRSLGAAIAIQLATEVDPRALVIEAPFTSIPELGARRYPWLPVKYLARIRYDSMKKIQHIRVPKLFVHSLDDEVVPFGMGKRLYNRAARPKQFVRIRGPHNEEALEPGSKYAAAFQEFLESVASTRRRKGIR